MAKSRTSYLCRECGGVQSQWMGKCPDCGAWDALEKYIEPKDTVSASAAASIESAWLGGGDSADDGSATPQRPRARRLVDVEAESVPRLPTGIGEFDRVLGGGLINGSVVLLGGDPGIGKSTLLLQAAATVASRDRRVLYVTSEESAYQTRLRAERLVTPLSSPGRATNDQIPQELYILADTNLSRILEQARTVRPAMLVVDSIQMIFNPDVVSSPGSIAQLRRCCLDLVHLAKISGIAVFLVGHVTKQGQLAGPKLIEHLVDTVLSFEGDRHHAHRVVRAIKNRFGNTLEVGLFEMSGHGLREVEGGRLLLSNDGPPRPGSVICPAMHGSRCLLVEVQALTATGFPGSVRRKAVGLDVNRLPMLIAVLEKHGGLRLADQDVYASTTGGLRVTEPGADLAVCMAIAGAHYKKRSEDRIAVVGEVGLGGEVRPVSGMEARLQEALRLGAKRVVLSSKDGLTTAHEDRVSRVGSVQEAIALLETPGRQ